MFVALPLKANSGALWVALNSPEYITSWTHSNLQIFAVAAQYRPGPVLPAYIKLDIFPANRPCGISIYPMTLKIYPIANHGKFIPNIAILLENNILDLQNFSYIFYFEWIYDIYARYYLLFAKINIFTESL